MGDRVSCPEQEPWLYQWLDKKSALGEGVLYARRHRVEGRRHPLSVLLCPCVYPRGEEGNDRDLFTNYRERLAGSASLAGVIHSFTDTGNPFPVLSCQCGSH